MTPLEEAVLRAQAAEHQNLVLLDELALKTQRDIIASGNKLDRDLGIDTEGERLFDRSEWDDAGVDVSHFEDYEASPTRMIDGALDAIPFPIERATFVDLGCGKGRTLFLAARRTFARAVGVEIMPDLAAIARENLARLDRTLLPCADIEIVQAEATTYEFPPGDLVVYMYNPFDDTILSPIVDRLALMTDRRIAVAYYWPKYRNLFFDNPAFVLAGSFPNGLVFETVGPDRRTARDGSAAHGERHLLPIDKTPGERYV
jgi:SAM-dependent methyltransferase